MTRPTEAFDALIDGLRGRPMEVADWEPIIALANHTLLTPALFSALVRSDHISRVPEEVRAYLQFVCESNKERNSRLRGQLFEAVGDLNRHGIDPLLLKGAVLLFESPASDLPDRITSDLDIALGGSDIEAAEACLQGLGYIPVIGVRGVARPRDVGLLELREKQEDARWGAPTPVEWKGIRALIPTPQARARNWILHDLLKEGDYLRGRLDLRHLHDLACLASDPGLDWAAVRSSMPRGVALDAFDTQMLALEQLFGVSVPIECSSRRRIRFHHWRRLFAARHRLAGAPLRIAGNLAWGGWRVRRLAELAPQGPVEMSRRVLRTAFQLRPRSKL